MGAVVNGMDPHKRSATIEVMDGDETVLGGGRYATDVAGYAAMVKFGKQFGERTWAIEGCNGIGKHIANRLLADGELVVDVPPKLSARVRVFATGQGRKTDATDAHSVALVGTRMSGLRPVVDDEQLAVLRILVDRRRSLGDDHTRLVSQLHRLLLELIPGGAKTSLSAAQAKVLLGKVRPRDAAGKTRRRVAAELIADLQQVYDRTKAADKELHVLLTQTGTTLTQLHGIGPSGAARLLVEVGDITRFPDPRALRVLDRHRPHRHLIRSAVPSGRLFHPSDRPRLVVPLAIPGWFNLPPVEDCDASGPHHQRRLGVGRDPRCVLGTRRGRGSAVEAGGPVRAAHADGVSASHVDADRRAVHCGARDENAGTSRDPTRENTPDHDPCQGRDPRRRSAQPGLVRSGAQRKLGDRRHLLPDLGGVRRRRVHGRLLRPKGRGPVRQDDQNHRAGDDTAADGDLATRPRRAPHRARWQRGHALASAQLSGFAPATRCNFLWTPSGVPSSWLGTDRGWRVTRRAGSTRRRQRIFRPDQRVDGGGTGLRPLP